MIRQKLFTSMMFATGLLMGTALPAMAQPDPAQCMDKPFPPGPHHRVLGLGPMGDIFANANLTKEQRQKIRDLAQKTRQEVVAQHAVIRQTHEQVMDLLASSKKVTQETLQPLFAKEEAAHKAIHNAEVTAALSVRNLLSTDQLKAVEQTYGKRKELRSKIDNLLKEAGEAPRPPAPGDEPPPPPPPAE